MSMPGFVFHFRCLECEKSSPDYSICVFPDIFRAEITLPAWSVRFRCYSEVRCYLAPEDRPLIEGAPVRLRELVAQLSSPRLTVGFPLWSQGATEVITVEPPPICPFCGCSVETLIGYAPEEQAEPIKDIGDPYAVPFSRLGLSVRALNCLRQVGIESLGDLCERTPADLLKIPQFGETTLHEVQKKVEAAGFTLRHD